MAETKVKPVPEMEQAPNIGQNPEMEMTDYQKMQMTQMAYLDFEESERLKGMKLSEVGQYLSTPSLWSTGMQFSEQEDAWLNQAASKLVEGSVGKEIYSTDGQLYDRCVEAGLGDLRIKDIACDRETGFQAMALEDSQGNVYFSFRGSDFDFTKSGGQDWTKANLMEFMEGEYGTQAQQAVEFFDKNKSVTGENHLYGHSLGGNLTSHVFLQREHEVADAFCYNANPVSERLANTPERRAALQSERFTFAITEGDVVSSFKGTELYANRTVYIESRLEGGNFLQNHLAEAASYNKDGSFVQTTQDAHLEDRDQSKVIAAVLGVTQGMDSFFKNHEQVAECIAQICSGEWKENIMEAIQEISPEAAEWIGKVYNSFLDGQQGLDMITPQDLSQAFGGQMQTPQQDVSFVTPEQLMAMTGGMMGAMSNPEQMMSMDGMMQIVNNMEQSGQTMEGYDMSQFVDQMIGQAEGTIQTATDGLLSWGEETPELDPEMEQEEDGMQIKFAGMEL